MPGCGWNIWQDAVTDKGAAGDIGQQILWRSIAQDSVQLLSRIRRVVFLQLAKSRFMIPFAM